MLRDPLMSDTVIRRPIHTRRIEYASFLRGDGLYEVEGSLIDVLVASGKPKHIMSLVLTFDQDLTIHGVSSHMEAGPFPSCHDNPDLLQGLVGVQIAPGWQQRVRAKISNNESCTHHMELLFSMATAAYMAVSLAPEINGIDPLSYMREKGIEPYFLNGCRAWRTDGPVVKALFPELGVPR